MARKNKRSKKPTVSKAASNKDNYRHPPLPDSYYAMIPGQCRWCGLPVLKKNGNPGKGMWHTECLKPYFFVTRPQIAKRFIYRRDKGICSCCGQWFDKRNGHLEHTIPLRDAPRELKYWQEGNLTFQCKVCHLAKSLQENAARRLKKKNI